MAEVVGNTVVYRFTQSERTAIDAPPVEPETDITRFAIGKEWDRMGKPGTQSEKYFQLVRPSLDRPSPTITATAGQTGAAGVLSLQFTPIECRQKIIADVYRMTRPGGAFVVVEKCLGDDSASNALLVESYYAIRILTSSISPVSLTEVGNHLRLDNPAGDTVVAPLIESATQFVENETRQYLRTKTVEVTLDSFPDGRVISIPVIPLQAVASIKFTDTAGNEQTISPSLYSVDTVSRPGRVILKPGLTWPATDTTGNAVRITAMAGHANCPELLQQCVLLMVGHWFENREAAIDRRVDMIPLAVDSILAQYRFMEVA